MRQLAAATAAVALLAPTAATGNPGGSTLLVGRPTGLAPLAAGISNSSHTRVAASGGDREAGENVSDDGSRIVFTSDSDGLSAADDNRYTNCFLRANATTTTLLSVAAGGAPANAHCSNPVISGDGTTVAFETRASNLDPGATDANSFSDVYLRDLVNGTTTLISHAAGSDTAAGGFEPSISEDGTRIAFGSFGQDLDPSFADGVSVDVFVRDVGADTVTLASRSAAAAGDGASSDPSIDASGTVVAFETTAANLHPDDANAVLDVHLRDLQSGVNRLVSRAGGAGAVGDAASGDPAVSGDGAHVAFESSATNLVSGDTNGAQDVFVRTDVGATEAMQNTIRASVKSDGSQGGNGLRSRNPSISGDGSLVAFETWMTDAVIGDASFQQDIWVRDLSGSTELASATTGSPGTASNAGSNATASASISADGTRVVFHSDFDAASPDDDDRWSQVFSRALDTDTTTLVSRSGASGAEPRDAMESSQLGVGGRKISRDGRYVVFLSGANDLVNDQDDSVLNAYRRDLVTGTTILVSRASDGTPANRSTDQVAISADGSKVAFASTATNLGDGANGSSQIFWRDVDSGVTRLVSRRSGPAGAIAGGFFTQGALAISADGARVAWESGSPNLHPSGELSDTNNVPDIFVRDVPSDTTLLASIAPGGSQATGASRSPSLDGDGSTVAFASDASNLVGGDGNGVGDVFVRDLDSGVTVAASRASGPAGALGNAASSAPSIDEAGTKVAFSTAAGNLAGGEDGSGNDVYRRDLITHTTLLVSRTDGSGGTAQNLGGVADAPELSGDGVRVAFATTTGSGSDGDSNGLRDVYVRDVGAAETSIVSVPHAATAGALKADSRTPSISLDGNCVVFASQAEGLTSDYPGTDFEQVYLRVLDGECPDVAPETSIDGGPAGPTSNPTPSFSFSSEPGATLECRTDAAGYGPCTSPYEAGPLPDGPHTFQVRATDAAGNTDPTPATRSFSVDTAAPETAIEAGPAGPTPDAAPSFSFSSSEPGVAFTCRTDDGPFGPCESPHETAPLPDGQHTLHVRATDPAGNTDPTPATRSFSVDTAAPETAIDGGPSGLTPDATPSFSFSSSEAGAAFECRTGDGAYGPCSPPHETAPLPDGPHTFYVRATDAVGNTDPTPATRSFTVDTTAPRVELSIARRGLARTLRRGLSVTLRCSEACAGRLEVLVPRGPGPATVSLAGGERHRLKLPIGRKLRRKLARRKRQLFRLRATLSDPLSNTIGVRASRRLRR